MTTKIKFAPEPDVEDSKRGHSDEEQISLFEEPEMDPEKVVCIYPRNRIGSPRTRLYGGIY